MTDDRDLVAALRRVLTAEAPKADSVARIVRRFEPALPPQKRSFAWWPAALTDWNFAPAWPRVAALACARSDSPASARGLPPISILCGSPAQTMPVAMRSTSTR